MAIRDWSISLAAALIAVSAIGQSPSRAAPSRPTAKAARVMWAAEHGDARAQTYLGWLYSIGRGVPQHFDLAAKWYRCGAEKGNGAAQFALGLLYNKGKGVPKDFILSYMWLNLSAAQAVGEDRDFKVRIRDSVASKMTPQQVELAQDLAQRPRVPRCFWQFAR